MSAFAAGVLVGVLGALAVVVGLGLYAERRALDAWRNGGPPNGRYTVSDAVRERRR